MIAKVYSQKTRADSPRSTKERIGMMLWEYTWALLCSWTPKPANPWRLFWLNVFGAKLYGQPFVHQRARIFIPWNLILHDRACLGDRANVYSQGLIEIHEFAVVSQEAYICTGTHAFDQAAMNLITAPVSIGAHAFIGARAFIMPGVSIGEQAIVGSCSVVTRNVAPWKIVAGNPSREIGIRTPANNALID